MNTYKRSPILRGDILYAELGAAAGSEQAGFRPVVVVQNDVGNRYSPTVVVGTADQQYQEKHFADSCACRSREWCTSLSGFAGTAADGR